MADKITRIIKDDTCTMVDRHSDLETSRIVLKNKYRADGSLKEKKAGLASKCARI